VALELLESNPDEVRSALLAIKQASKGGLDEVRAVLAELRDPAPRGPAPDLDRLDDLIAEYPGLSVTLSKTGTRQEIPAAIGLAGYRIIQEALTNVIRHSQARSAVVHVHQAEHMLLIGVADDGPASHAEGEPGTGLIGIRERAAALGGVAEIEPGPGKGFHGPRGTAAVIRVLLADDQALVRAGFRALLDAQADITVVAEAGDGAEALAAVEREHPDVVLMDIRMPHVDGLEATRRIAADDRFKDTKVIVLTTFELDDYVFTALRDGAAGFLVKDTEPADLIKAVRVVAAGEALLSPGVTRRLIEEYASRSRPVSRPARQLELLTEREREVVTLVGLGLSNEEIAARLVVSPLTAKTHVSRAMVKLNARDRAQLVVMAYESGLVRPGWTD
jgi:DNA-binding NarL/FixJ family response regulator